MIRSAIDSLNQAEPLPYNWTPAASAMRAHSDWRGRRLDPCRDLVGHFPNEITFVAYPMSLRLRTRWRDCQSGWRSRD